MKLTTIIDSIQRRVNSILFRLILVLYSLGILLLNSNYLNQGFYWLIVPVYVFFYFLLNNWSKLRLANDFIFIGLTLLGKDPNHPANLVFLLLPIINSINFSGDRKSILLYVYTFSLYVLLGCFHVNLWNEPFNRSNVISLLPIIALWLINSYTTLRLRIRNFRESLNDVVDGFYLNKKFIKRPHKVYDEIIQAIHTTLKEEPIEGVFCFTPMEGNELKLSIVNGSTFIWKFNFEMNDLNARLREKRVILNEPITIDGVARKTNLILYTKVENQEYFFVFITKKAINPYYIIIGFFRTLEPAFTKIARVLLTEKTLSDVRNEEIMRMSESALFISRANKTMHFVRNRLNPLSNLLKMLDNMSGIPADRQKGFDSILLYEIERTKIDLKGIVERANNMLEKSNNPFVYTTLQPMSLYRLFSIEKRLFRSFFPELDIDVDVNTNGEKRFVSVHEEGLEIVLSDWLNNMKKYGKSNVYCGFKLFEDDLLLIFRNDHSLPPDELQKLVDDLMSDDRNEIMRRTTHGLLTIKLILAEMKVPMIVNTVNDKKDIELILTFKTSNQ